MGKMYCIFCGNENDETADVCAHCGKTMHPKENLFLEYLESSVKSDLKGKAETKAFTVIRDWLLSHLYGLVVTVMLIAAVVIRVNASSAVPSYIETVSSEDDPVSVSAESGISEEDHADKESHETGKETVILNDEEEKNIIHVATEFETLAFFAGGEYRSSNELMRASASEYILPASSGYTGSYEVMTVNEATAQYSGFKMIKQGAGDLIINDPVTDLEKQMMADGHTVAHITIPIDVYDKSDTLIDSFEYLATLVCLGDDPKDVSQWYVAECLLNQ